jgi:hypothetical protein
MARLIIFTEALVKHLFLLDGNHAKYYFPDMEQSYINKMLEESDNNCTKSEYYNFDMTAAVVLYSYVFQNFDTDELRGKITLKKTDVERYFGLSQSKNGSRLFNKIKNLGNIKIYFNGTWYKLVNILEDRGRYIDLMIPVLPEIKDFYLEIKEMSEHEKQTLAALKHFTSNELYYTKTVDSKLLKMRSPIAIAIVIELAKLVATTHVGGEPHISAKTLVDNVPMLRFLINDPTQSISAKNQHLRRIFKAVYKVIDDGESVYIKNCTLIDKPIPQLKTFDCKAILKERYVIRFSKKLKKEEIEDVQNGYMG